MSIGTLRHEDNKVLIDVGSTTYQIETITSKENLKLDKLIGLDVYVQFESVAGSQLTFKTRISTEDVVVWCWVRRIFLES